MSTEKLFMVNLTEQLWNMWLGWIEQKEELYSPFETCPLMLDRISLMDFDPFDKHKKFSSLDVFVEFTQRMT